MINRLQPAAGHVARIIPFDERTVLLPLNEDEARRLFGMVEKAIKTLAATGDFPEYIQYKQLRDNLATAMWMFTERPPEER